MNGQSKVAANPITIGHFPDGFIEKVNKAIDFIEMVRPRIEEGIEGRWLDAGQAAKHLNVSRDYLLMNLKNEIGFSKIGKKIVFDVRDLDEFWMKRKTKKEKGR